MGALTNFVKNVTSRAGSTYKKVASTGGGPTGGVSGSSVISGTTRPTVNYSSRTGLNAKPEHGANFGDLSDLSGL